MIYSRWDPALGMYDYFDAPWQTPGINDDLPIPNLPPATEIGVPSTECGRPLPAGAEHVGTGEWAVGLLSVPAHVDRIGQTPMTASQFGIVALAAALGVGAGLLIARRPW